MASEVHRSQTHLTPSRANFMILVFTAIFGFIGLGYIGAVIGYLIPLKGAGSRPQDLGPITADAVGGVRFNAGVAGPFTYDATGRGDAQGVFAVRTGSSRAATSAAPWPRNPGAAPSTVPATGPSLTR